MHFIFLLILGIISNAESENSKPFQLNPTWTEPDQTVTKRFNYFDLELLQKIYSESNVFISPASVKATLGMILEGASGLCADEITKTLRLPANQEDVRSQLKPLLYELSDRNQNSILESANGLFVNDRLTLLDSYVQKIDIIYRGFLKKVNFDNVNQASDTINKWINNSTNGLIPYLVDPAALDPKTSLLVANALYFKGTWKYPFDSKLTAKKCFQLNNRECFLVQMMQNTAEVPYVLDEEIDAHALSLPYTDDKYALLILLPRVKNSVPALMKDLQHTTFGAILNKLEVTEVYYEIPRFSIEFLIDFTESLRDLGIRQLFDDRANLTGIVENQQVFVNSVYQRARIDVNEQGTTASAATGASVVPLMGSSKPRLIADHPFAFFIYRVDNKNILFEGIVNQPTRAR